MRRWSILVGGVCVAGLAAAGFAFTRDSAGAAPEPSSTEDTGLDLATVEQRDLVRSEEVDGVVGHGVQKPLRMTANGTVTSLPEVGHVIEYGHPILEVDGEPVLMLPGPRPAWRSLGAGVGKGEDVRQLEAALVILGYGDPAKVTVDDTWTAATTTAVKTLQRFWGLPEDGRLDLGEVVFAIEVLRVAEVTGGLGDPSSSAGIEVTGLEQSVDVSLTATQVGHVDAGDAVTIELPSGETIDGVVQSIGQPVSGQSGDVTFPFVITTDAIDVGDGIPVTVTFTVVAREDAVAVPAEALLALAEGGYAVETPDPSTATGTQLVGVEIGTFADGWVEVTGDVAPGDEVVVP